MAEMIKLPTFTDERGSLTTMENEIPFKLKRAYYIYDIKGQRGGHGHFKTRQAVICLTGKCLIVCNNGGLRRVYTLDSPDKMLVVEPEDWHYVQKLSGSGDLMILVLASELYDKSDYFYEEP
jgi:dTDP-4-dehydrorhamnose 3,5-epimerase-like enzyme